MLLYRNGKSKNQETKVILHQAEGFDAAIDMLLLTHHFLLHLNHAEKAKPQSQKE